MKNLSVALNGVLLVAVVVLYVLHFSNSSDVNTDDALAVEKDVKDLSIAYINSDTLLKNYVFFEELTAQLGEKRTKLEAEFTNRATGLQKQIQDYQQTANNMTMAQARAVEEDLTKKQQNLQQYQETLSQELRQEEAKITQELYEKVSDFLKGYGEENGLQVVLTYTPGSGVLYANEGLDITRDVIGGLNTLHESGEVADDANGAKKDTTKKE